MFSRQFFPSVLFFFSLFVFLSWSLPSTKTESRREALAAIFDVLEKHLHDEQQQKHLQQQENKPAVVADKEQHEADKKEANAAAEGVEREAEEETAEEPSFGEVGAAEKRQMLSPVKRVSFDSPVMAATELNAAQIQDILQLHKVERMTPGGNDEMAMTWDDDLASLAQGLSDSCHWGHDNMKLPNGDQTGQNIALWSNPNTDVGKLVQLWINEKQDYTISSGACTVGKVCGHYTQMVWSESTKVGCGATKCPGMGIFLVCDYSPAGNWQGKKAIHLGGKPCSKCNLYPGTNDDDGLCSVCDPDKSSSCRPYDASQCKDAKVDPNVGDCGWVKPYCVQSKYRKWLEASCAKTCGYCKS